MSRTLARRTTWSIITGAYKTAPRRSKMLLGFLLPFALLYTAWVAIETYTRPDPREASRMWAMVAGNLGLFLIALTQMLHTSSQRMGNACLQSGLTHRVQRMHQMLMALPAMAFTAGILVTAAVVLLLPAAVHSWPLMLSLVLYAAFIPLAGKMVTGTTRFLYQHAAEQAEAAAKARSDATEAQLTALQAQMNPHFLFNALNTVASLVRTDARAAESTVENLARVLRRTLDRSRRTLSSVEDEVDYVRAYLAVEQERHGARLVVQWSIDPATLPLALPTMTLQPLVENALKHAMGARLEGGQLRISSALRDGVLTLAVADDGGGFVSRYREGTGLTNLRARMATIYDDRARLTIDSTTSGATVRVEITQLPSADERPPSARPGDGVAVAAGAATDG